MRTNLKKPLVLKNRTKYFDPNKDRTHVRFGSIYTQQSRTMKTEGYENRLYWHYRDMEDNGGQCFFYTLTYNDAHVPQYLGKNVFDFEDLRDFEIGGFQKQLLRKYGISMKRAVFPELGDGKGERGFHNNPHYHIIFYLTDAQNPMFQYKPIDPVDFRHLVRMYWQGFDEDVDKKTGEYHRYEDALHGICREGLNLGVVDSYRAVAYVSKYCVKDQYFVTFEKVVEEHWRYKYTKKLKASPEFHEQFFHTVLNPMFNLPLNAKHTAWTYEEPLLVDRLLPDYFNGDLPFDVIDYVGVVKRIVDKYGLDKEYTTAYEAFVEEKVHEAVCEFRNRYSHKVRVSHGLGDYALKFIDKKNPTIQMPSEDGFKNRPISQYYYRKLFTDVIVDKKGSNIRVLNEDGINYKVSKLSEQVSRKIDRTLPNLNFVINDVDLYERMKQSDVNTEVTMSHLEFLRTFKSLTNDISIHDILKRYAEFKLVYEDRFFRVDVEGPERDCDFPRINPVDDYRRFLHPSIFIVRRSDLRLSTFLEMCPEDYVPYHSHPYFLRYRSIFNVLDLVADYFFVQKDDRDQKETEERAAIRRFHKKLEFQNSLCLTI